MTNGFGDMNDVVNGGDAEDASLNGTFSISDAHGRGTNTTFNIAGGWRFAARVLRDFRHEVLPYRDREFDVQFEHAVGRRDPRAGIAQFVLGQRARPFSARSGATTSKPTRLPAWSRVWRWAILHSVAPT